VVGELVSGMQEDGLIVCAERTSARESRRDDRSF
jgi:hypothetical protein